jgi:hypothetical protein
MQHNRYFDKVRVTTAERIVAHAPEGQEISGSMMGSPRWRAEWGQCV